MAPTDATDQLVEHPDRFLVFDRVHNVRDLGGYPADGGRVRWRTLFRADGLNLLDGEDVERFAALGVRTVIDLRMPGEVEQRGRFPVERHPVTWHHHSILDVGWDHSLAPDDPADVVPFLRARYLEMLDTAAERLVAAFATLAEPGALPAVFHCAAGKDRTGVLAAIVLSTLGVPDHLVAADYGLSARAMERMLDRARQAPSPEAQAWLDNTPAAFLAAHPEAMADVLAEVRLRHGSMAGYLTHHGVDAGVVDAMRAALVEPS